MSVRKKLFSANQITLIAISVVVAVVANLLLLSFEWHRKTNDFQVVLDGYTDKSAYHSCLERALRGNETKLLAKLKCEAEWGEWKRAKKVVPPFQDYFVEYITRTLGLMLLIAASIYVMMSTCIMYSKCTNIGWRRLTIIAALIPSFMVALYMYNHAGQRVSGEQYLRALLGAIAGYVVAAFIILGSRQAVAWIKDGFNKSND